MLNGLKIDIHLSQNVPTYYVQQQVASKSLQKTPLVIRVFAAVCIDI